MKPVRQMLLDLWWGDPEDSASNPTQAESQQAPAATTSEAIEPAIPLAEALSPAQFTHPQATHRIRLGPAQVAYLLRRGQRRTIGLSVSAEGLTVSAPRWSSLPEVEAVLREKARWVLAKLGDAQQRAERQAEARIDWREGAELPFLGTPLVLALDPRQRHGGGAVLQPPEAEGAAARLLLGLPHSATPAQLRDTTQAWLMRQARRVFTQRLDHFAPQLGVRWQRLALSSAGTRWGSASADGSIRLNWRLIHFREPVIDYVVVHELAHLREMNHSPRFWQHVQGVLPDYAERRNHLRHAPVPSW